MTELEALRELCLKCERNIGAQHKGCPWRSLSNDFCDEYEKVKKALKKLEYIESIEKKYMINAVACMTLMGEMQENSREKENQMLSERLQKTCDKYSQRDEEGKVHCMDCPLRVGTNEFDFRCKANSTYDKKTKEWILDTNNIYNNKGEKENEEQPTRAERHD